MPRLETWHRFILLAMLALAVLVTAASNEQPEHHDPRHDELVPVSVGEFRRLILAAQLTDELTYTAAIRWSWWRRRHQATARKSHYKRRDINPTSSQITSAAAILGARFRIASPVQRLLFDRKP
jgi:hypothetical protein